MNIDIKIIPHEQQRYPTVGDYWLEDKDYLFVRISKMTDWRYEALVIIHELVEYFVITKQGIKIEDIDAFDKTFEADRELGKHSQIEEPGNHPKAPYRVAHKFATKVEKLCAFMLGVSWSKYSREVETL